VEAKKQKQGKLCKNIHALKNHLSYIYTGDVAVTIS